MATVTHAGTTWNTTAGNKTVVATPAANDLIVVVSPYTANITAGVTDNNSGGGGTYTQVDTDRTGFSTAGHLKVWIRDALISSATSTTFTASQPSSTGGGLTVFRVSGMTRTGALAVLSNGGQSTGTAGTTPTPVLSATPQSGNPIIAAVCNGSNTSTTVVERSGYTEASDLGYNTPAAGFESCFLNSGETSATITFGGTTATAFASVAVELDTSAVPGPTITAFQTANWTTTTSPLTISVTGALNGDLILVGFGGDRFSTAVTAASTSTTGGSTSAWTETNENLGGTNTGWGSMAWADVTADGTVTVSIARTQSPGRLWGGFALLAHDHGGIGVNGTIGQGATETVSLTVAADSAVGLLGVDWDALTEVAFSPSGGNTVFRDQVGAGPDVTFYAGYWLAQAAGTRGYGIATSSTTALTLFAAEILAATGGASIDCDASLTATATLTATAAVARPADASLTGTATLTATAVRAANAAAALTATATHTATAAVSRPVDSTLTVTASRAAAASISRPADASLTATATITATATVTRPATATLTATAGITATAAKVTSATASLTATAGITADASVGAVAALTATATITATAVRLATASATLTATATHTATASAVRAATASLSGTAAHTATATITRPAAAALTVTAGITATADIVGPVAPTVPRPGAGVVPRPGAGVIARAASGTTVRAPSGTVARPFAGTTPRP